MSALGSHVARSLSPPFQLRSSALPSSTFKLNGLLGLFNIEHPKRMSSRRMYRPTEETRESAKKSGKNCAGRQALNKT